MSAEHLDDLSFPKLYLKERGKSRPTEGDMSKDAQVYPLQKSFQHLICIKGP